MSRHVPQITSFDPLELVVWAAEFARARYNSMTATMAIDQSDYAIDNAINSANFAVADLRRAYKR